MSLIKYKPKTPCQRFRIANTINIINKSLPEKSLTKGISSSGGRNNVGKMTMCYLGGGHKRKYRIIDFKRDKIDIPATVKTIEYDPNRSSFISLLYYIDGEKRYILSQKGLKIGKQVISGTNVPPDIGNSTYLNKIPLGTIISCLEIQPGQGGKIARSAGSYAQLVAREGKYATIKLPSGDIRIVLNNCRATIGSISNSDKQFEVYGKAGRNRWLGKRPRTRAVAMNPIDHPMGGGEGKATGGLPRSRKGILAHGYKTVSKKRKTKN
ncbi:50S ribosomal protein L2 [Candidatus Uzinura diaspidicola str. ASNER]|uniref:Large ribosomal subunit protein uL2 n=1 Tax=Candidatus Uzinura diaspidicola str. ASNER TaxID=1133592 RepID=L7VG22_9FLAO|nr:50S ribosomal protein L2 [Candidatus Uzinura diaspidicola str. ASNER]